MTITEQPQAAMAASGGPAGCRYPGCGNPARDHDGPGRRPGYCGREVPEDHGDGTSALVRHTALTAFRRRQQAAGQTADERPVTAAIGRAGAIRDDALAAMARLGAQLAAALDQLAALGEQLAAAGGPEAAEAQAEAVRAEAAARAEQARAETAGHAAARHAAELDAAEARAAAAEAITAMEAARAGADALAGERDARSAELDAALTAAQEERRAREEDRRRHDAALASASAAVTALREQLARAETALDRERAEQHKTTALLHGLLAGRETPEPKAAARRQPGGH